jgi:hypothetical protein
MEAERQLYERSGSLVTYLLDQWKYNKTDAFIEGAMERLFVDLYERGIVEQQDVELAQLWISSLQSVGYKFPVIESSNGSLKQDAVITGGCSGWRKSSQRKAFLAESKEVVYEQKRCELHNVVLVGQFNFETKARTILHWVKRWRQVFPQVDVRGPFDMAVVKTLKAAGVNVYHSVADRGWYSPMQNLADSLRLYADDPNFCGVAIVHDDLLINVQHLVARGFPSDNTIFTEFPTERIQQPLFTIYLNATFKLQHDEQLFAVDSYSTTLYKWRWWDRIIPNVTRAVAVAPGRQRYMRGDGGMDFYRHGQVDFLYIPTSMAEQFASYADWMVENEIFLEVSTPTILAKLKTNSKRKFNPFRFVPSGTLRKEAMLMIGFLGALKENRLGCCIQ